MKPVFFLVLLLQLVASCRKEGQFVPGEQAAINRVQATLNDSLSAVDYQRLAFAKAVRTRINKDTSYLRIPFRDQALKEAFVVVQIDDAGRVNRGRMISVTRQQNMLPAYAFHGFLVIRWLTGKEVIRSRITRGYIEAFHATPTLLRSTIVPAPEYQEMPEVIVVASRTQNGVLSFSDYLWLQGLFNDAYRGVRTYYSNMEDSGTAGDREGGETSWSNLGGAGFFPAEDFPLLIDFETEWSNPAIDIEKYLKCFDAIPDAGATCSIEIFADIPVDSDPNKLFNFESGSPGHTFLQIKKSNGSQSVMQNIGFYPKDGWKTLMTNAPVEGKLVDNSQHEFNASFKMYLSPENFKSTLNEILYLSRFIKYDIDNYNCTDFALDVFNKTRADKLEIPLYDIPSNLPSTGTRTPQGLYNKLKSMQQSRHPESSNISIPGVFGWVGDGKGPCN